MKNKMETIVWWRGGILNQEVKWKPLHGGTEGDESLIEEVKPRPLYGGAHGGDGN